MRTIAFCLLCLMADQCRAEVYSYAKAHEIAKDEKKPIAVIVSSDSCVYCDMLMREVEQLQAEGMLPGVVFAKVNVTSDPMQAKAFPATKYPTIYFYETGWKKRYKMEGFRAKDLLVESIKKRDPLVQ